MYGDLKEDPILVDHNVTLSDCSSILRYLADKFCVTTEWYPSSVIPCSRDDIQRQATIEQWLNWAETHVKWPIHQIFWKEVFPRIDFSSASFDQSRQAVMTLNAAYHDLNNALYLLENSLGDRPILVSGKLSAADIFIVEQLTMIPLFQQEALESYPNITGWMQRMKDSVTCWNEVNADFNTFFQFAMTISSNECIPCVTFRLSFFHPPEKIFSQMVEATKHSLGSRMNVGTESSEDDLGLTPERVVIQNYKDDHIPNDHFSALEFQLTGTPERIPNTKLFFNLINVPLTKMKVSQDEWSKVFKQWGGIQVTQWQASIYLPFPRNTIWELLLHAAPLSSATKSNCAISPRCGEAFSLFDGSVTGSNVKLNHLELIVQKWRLSDWSEHHFSTLTYLFESCTLGGIKGTILRCTQWNIPVDKLKDVDHKHKDFWKKAKGHFVENLAYDAYFGDTTSAEVLKVIKNCISDLGIRLQTRTERSTKNSLLVTWDLPSDNRSIPSQINLNIVQMGDR